MSIFKSISLLSLASSFTNVHAIFNGVAVNNKTEYPFFAELSIGGSHDCGGALINATSVITAAHCAQKDFKNNPYQLIFQGGKTVNVVNVTLHPEFSNKGGIYVNDVAILTLESSISDITPVTLQLDTPVATNTSVIVMGMGMDQNGQMSSNLMSINTTVLPASNCNSTFVNYDDSKVICVDGNGKSAASGDSGAPMLLPTGEQVGLVTYGDGSNIGKSPFGCTRLSNYKSFILSIVPDAKLQNSTTQKNNTPSNGTSSTVASASIIVILSFITLAFATNF